MKRENFNRAIEILTAHHSNTIIINHVEPNGSIGDLFQNPTIHIKNCVPNVVNILVKEGFSLSPKNGLIEILHF